MSSLFGLLDDVLHPNIVEIPQITVNRWDDGKAGKDLCSMGGI
ncbi:hypothetical protein OAU26_05945 [Mariniblastus sp.]|nr:hypothetical protein [Mariniblastus sp.]